MAWRPGVEAMGRVSHALAGLFDGQDFDRQAVLDDLTLASASFGSAGAPILAGQLAESRAALASGDADGFQATWAAARAERESFLAAVLGGLGSGGAGKAPGG